MIQINLVDRNQEMCDEWNKHFSNLNNVKVHCGDFFDLNPDCIVSPANSFGFMDGGLDAVITKKLGKQVQENAQNIIQEMYDGELLVGQSILVRTDNNLVPFCLISPTMRIPQKLKDSINIYLASKSIFLKIKELENFYNYPKPFDYDDCEPLSSINISGLGTGIGGISFNECARVMKLAYDEFYLGNYKFPTNVFEAQKGQSTLYWNFNN